jgi:hypothetical protein
MEGPVVLLSLFVQAQTLSEYAAPARQDRRRPVRNGVPENRLVIDLTAP